MFSPKLSEDISIALFICYNYIEIDYYLIAGYKYYYTVGTV